MKVLVDTCVWSMYLRRHFKVENHYLEELKQLLIENRIQMIGAIRQEILSGIQQYSHFEILRDHLRSFPDIELNKQAYELAAEFYNHCRTKGIQGSNTDFLICAISAEYHMGILTTDKDFTLFAGELPIHLAFPRV